MIAGDESTDDSNVSLNAAPASGTMGEAPSLMLLQTNSYIVPKEKRAAHNHLMQRFRQVLQKVGCDHFEVYEQVGTNWNGIDAGGRFVQLMKFRDRKHCQAVQLVERQDSAAQALVREFCDLINFPYQEQQGLFAHGYYQAVIDPIRTKSGELAFHNYPSGDAQADIARVEASQLDTVNADTARRIAAGLPDTPHSIDDAPQMESAAATDDDAFAEESPADTAEARGERAGFEPDPGGEFEGDDELLDLADFVNDPPHAGRVTDDESHDGEKHRETQSGTEKEL